MRRSHGLPACRTEGTAVVFFVTVDRALAPEMGKDAGARVRPERVAPALVRDQFEGSCRERFDVTEEEVAHTPERMVFKLPRELTA